MIDGHILTLTKLMELYNDSEQNLIYKPEKLNWEKKSCIHQALTKLPLLLYRAKNEIDGLFTVDEACLICDALNEFLYTEAFSAKEFLITVISESISINELDKKWRVDGELFTNKLNNLSEFHAFIVILIVNEFWEDESDDFIPIVKQLFGIK